LKKKNLKQINKEINIKAITEPAKEVKRTRFFNLIDEADIVKDISESCTS